MRRHFLAIAVILTVPTGCDNVAWGGIDVSVEAPDSDGRAPASPAEGAADGAAAAVAEQADAQPFGPVLLAGVRGPTGITFTPVGVLTGEGLERFPPSVARRDATVEALGPGSEWTLFAAGARVGTATVTGRRASSEACGLDVVLDATPNLLPAATGADRLLALPQGFVEDRTFEAYAPLAHTYNQRVASLDLGRTALPRIGAPWPPNGMLPVRRDIQAFRPAGDATPSFGAVFVVGDTLDTSPAAAGSYALFLMADEGPQGFRERYLWYRHADDGKGAPRFFSHLDWDDDGRGEVLLEVFGEGRRGYVALERGPDGRWVEVFRSDCPPTVGATER